MLNNDDLDVYEKKIEDGDKLLKKELDKLISSFKDKVRFEAEDMHFHHIDQISFESFFNMREYELLLNYADRLKEDITELYIPLLKVFKYEIDINDSGKYIKRIK